MKAINDHTRVCPVCGKIHYPPDLETYVFQRDIKEGKTTKRLYFCKWSCLQAWEAGRKKNRKEEEEKRRKIAKELAGESFCADCRYCIKGKFGFVDCTLYSVPTQTGKEACGRFKPKWDYQKEVE